MKTHTHNNNTACSTPRSGRLAPVCKLGRLMVMLAVVNIAATANAGNPFSVDQHKNGMTIRFEPLKLFVKKPKAKPADPVPQVAVATNAASAADRGATVAANPSSTDSNAQAGVVSAGMAATAVPSAPQPTSPLAATYGQTPAPRLPVESLNRPDPGSLSGFDSLIRQMQPTPFESQAEYQRAWLRHMAARAEAQRQVQNYLSDVAGDLGPMGIESR